MFPDRPQAFEARAPPSSGRTYSCSDLVAEHGTVYLHAALDPSDAPLGPPHRMTLAQLREAHGAFPSDAPVEITR